MADGCSRTDLPAHRPGGRSLSRRRTPQRLPGLVDSHAHLQHTRFDDDREDVIQRARDAGLTRILVPGWDVRSSEGALELAAGHPDLIHAAVGVHPHDAAGMDEAAWARLEALAADPTVRAVGEIGLDYFRNLSPPQVQREAFQRQLELAAARGLPVVVHDRDAHRDVTDALLAWSGPEEARTRGVMHAFSGGAEMARVLAEAGFLISFALPVAFRSAVGPREAAVDLADGTFLVETDAPYLGPDRERRNEPTTALRVAAELARLRGTTPEAIAEMVSSAYSRLW
jgi:TatD DNase family protein